jgi:hypothetical protein
MRMRADVMLRDELRRDYGLSALPFRWRRFFFLPFSCLSCICFSPGADMEGLAGPAGGVEGADGAGTGSWAKATVLNPNKTVIAIAATVVRLIIVHSFVSS